MPKNIYAEPVSRLLTHGETDWDEWENYSTFEFTQDHVPELIRLGMDRFLLTASDEVGDDELWAPLHAWRALVQMFAVEAIRPLTQVLDWSMESDTDLINEGLTDALETFGEPVLEPITSMLNEPDHEISGYINAIDIITRVGKKDPELRDRAVAILTSALDTHFERNDEEVNGFLVSGLLDLNAVESYQVIKKAFEAGKVEDSIAGDLEEVEIDLGLRTKRDTPPPTSPFSSAMIRSLLEMDDLPSGHRTVGTERQIDHGKKEKNKRKQEKKSRRKNRKRK